MFELILLCNAKCYVRGYPISITKIGRIHYLFESWTAGRDRVPNGDHPILVKESGMSMDDESEMRAQENSERLHT